MVRSSSAPPISDDEHRLLLANARHRDLSALLSVLDETLETLRATGVEFMVMGGIASSCLGRQRWTHDIDVFVRPTDARRALEALEREGFVTEETYPDWLFKAHKAGQMVDVIFRSGGDIMVDDEMLARAPTCQFMGRVLTMTPPEDLVVIKAIVAAEHSPRHWYDALAVIRSTELDWQYLERRARHGIRRVLALLLYAQSVDLPVPGHVVADLFHQLEGSR